jgi:hypothetical protein
MYHEVFKNLFKIFTFITCNVLNEIRFELQRYLISISNNYSYYYKTLVHISSNTY